ncbi:MAG: thioredoxin family protein [Candidatus Aenigmarchaeota archaeon]|nr:thioredoxin family protein [Candidatus Aenigmarchaeota archaeon]
MTKIFFKFFSVNDGVCQVQRDIIKELKSIFGMMIDFQEIDIRNNKEMKEKYKITSTPTIIISCREEEKERFVGLTQELFLKKAIQKISKECR